VTWKMPIYENSFFDWAMFDEMWEVKFATDYKSEETNAELAFTNN
jgi:hypothetical protein